MVAAALSVASIKNVSRRAAAGYLMHAVLGHCLLCLWYSMHSQHTPCRSQSFSSHGHRLLLRSRFGHSANYFTFEVCMPSRAWLSKNYLRFFSTCFLWSSTNCAIPLSVSACLKSLSKMSEGTVAMCAPAFAASTTCMGERTEATITSVLNS